MQKISKFIGLAILLLAGMASALTIDGEKYWYCLEWTSYTSGSGYVILTQEKSQTNPYTSSTTCFENWPSSLEYSWKGASGSNIGRLISNMMTAKRLTTLKLGSDIDFGGQDATGACVESFTPMDNASLTSFDGQGHKIKNLCIKKVEGSTAVFDTVGFFTKTYNSGAEYKNVTFVDPKITISGATSTTVVPSVGVLLGKATDATISGVTVTGGSIDVSGSFDQTKSSAGGIVGLGKNLSLADVQVSSLNVKMPSNSGFVGGIVGKDTTLTLSGTIGVSGGSFQGRLVGGFAGQLVSNGSIDTPISVENVKISAPYKVGGLVGDLVWATTQTISNQKVSGLVSSDPSNYVGGLFGEVFCSASSAVSLTVSNIEVDGQITPGNSGGGLFGRVDANFVPHSLNVEDVKSRVKISGANAPYVGGIIGYTTLKSSIVRASAVGDISTTYSGGYAGGIIGTAGSKALRIVFSSHRGNLSATGTNVGYLVGYTGAVSTTSAADNDLQIALNYKVGTDNVEKGIGNLPATNSKWKNGTISVWGNIRNVGTDLTPTGILAPYSYTDHDMKAAADVVIGDDKGTYLSERLSYFRVPFKSTTAGTYFRNGIAADKQMKGALAATLNQLASNVVCADEGTGWLRTNVWMPEPDGIENILSALFSHWFVSEGVNDGYPYGGQFGAPTSSLPVYVDLTQEQYNALTTTERNNLGIITGGSAFEVSGSTITTSDNTPGFLFGGTDSDNFAEPLLAEAVYGLVDLLKEKGQDLHVATASDKPKTISLRESPLYSSDLRSLKLMETTCLDVVYQYCDGACVDLSEASEQVFVLSPLVSNFCDDESLLNLKIVPVAVTAAKPFGFLQANVETDNGKYIVKYSPTTEEGDTLTVNIPANFTVAYKAYALDGTSSLNEVKAGTSTTTSVNVPAYSNVSFDFTKAPLGYRYSGTYDATYKYQVYYKTCGDACYLGNSNSRSDVYDRTGSSFGVGDLLSGGLYEYGGTAQFNLKNLTSASQLDLYDVYNAQKHSSSLSNSEGTTTITKSLNLEPATELASYVVNFDLPTNATLTYDYDREIHYLVPSDFGGNYIRQLGDDLPKIYAIIGTSYSATGTWVGANPDNCYSVHDWGYTYVNGNYEDVDKGVMNYCGSTRVQSLPENASTLTVGMLQDAEYAGTLLSGDNGNDIVTLQPLFYFDTKHYNGKIGFKREENENTGHAFAPATLTLKQTYEMNGVLRELPPLEAHRSYDGAVSYYVYRDDTMEDADRPNFVFDVSYEVEPGFKIDGISFEGNSEAGTANTNYNPDTKKLTIPALKASDGGKFVFDVTALAYNVTYDLSDLGDSVFVASNFSPTVEGWTLLNDQDPMVYVRTQSSPNESYGRYERVVWNTAAVLENVEIVEGETPEVTLKKAEFTSNSSCNCSFGDGYLYAYVVAVNEDGSSLKDGDGNERNATEADYHGKLVLSQTVGTGDNARTYEHKSGFATNVQQILLPNRFSSQDEILAFDVKLEPDPGYAMSITEYSHVPMGGYDANDNPGEDPSLWDYDADNQKVNVRLSNYYSSGNVHFNVAFSKLDYRIKYLYPTVTEGTSYLDLFVPGWTVDGNYSYGWEFDEQVLNIDGYFGSSALTETGCLVGWVRDSVDNWPADLIGLTYVNSDNASYLSSGSGTENLNYMKLDLQEDHSLCDATTASFYTFTLETDGQGTLEIVQEIPSTVYGEEPLVIRHRFTPDATGRLTMKVPKISSNLLGPGSTIRLKVFAVPNNEGDLVKELSLDYTFAGVDGVFVGKDGMEFDVDRDFRFHVSFTPKGPYYVRYDLDLPDDASDSAKVYFPEEAKVQEEIEYNPYGLTLWAPYHAEKCFVGWSKKSSDNRTDADVVIREVDGSNLSEFSDNATSPTVLYPVWKNRGDDADCPTLASSHTERSAIRSGNTTGSYSSLVVTDVTGGSFVLTQVYDGKTFRHPIDNSTQYIPAGEYFRGYYVQVQPVPDEGFEFDEDSFEANYVDLSSASNAIDYDEEKGYKIAHMNGGRPSVDADYVDVTYYFGGTFSGSVPVMSLNSDNLDGHFELTQSSADAVTLGEASSRITLGKTTTITFVGNYGVSVSKVVVKAKNADGEVINGEGAGEELTLADHAATYTFVAAIEGVAVASYELVAVPTYDPLVVSFNTNSGTAFVSYGGTAWTGSASYNVNAPEEDLVLPVIYRSDATLKGWAFSEASTAAVYKIFDENAVAEYKSAFEALPEGQTAVPLFAVWDESVKPVIYTVANGSSDKGAMQLRGAVNDELIPFEEDEAKVPVAAGGKYKLVFYPNPGYVCSKFQLYDIMGNKVGDEFTAADEIAIAANTVVVALAEPSPYTLVFNVEAPDADVELFYSNQWVSEQSFDLDIHNELPANVYAVGYKLAGWRVKEENAETSHFDFAEVRSLADTAASNNRKLNVYAVWTSDEQAPVVISSANQDYEGVLSITPVVAGVEGTPITVTKSGVTVPQGNGDIEFKVSFVANEGFSVSNASYNAKDPDGEVATLITNTKTAKLIVSGNVAISAPVEATEPQVVKFDVNAPTDVTVFYGKDWTSSVNYDMNKSEVLPTEIYTNDYVLNGWKLSKTATELFKNFDAAAMYAAAVEGEVTLYADWAASDTVTKATITSASRTEGKMTLSQVVGGVETFSAQVGLGGVQVPLRKDIELNVKFVAGDGYSIDQNGFYTSTAAGGKAEAIAFTADGAKFSVTGDAAIAAPVKADGYQFAFDVNTEDNVFYVNQKVESGSYSFAITDKSKLLFPNGFYRAGYCHTGWAFTSTATTGYDRFDANFVAAVDQYATDNDAAPSKLYAVWTSGACDHDVTFSVANAAAGSVKLTDANSGKEFVLNAENSLQVPAVTGIQFTVESTVDEGYINLTGAPLFYMSEEEKIEIDGTLDVVESMTAVAINIPAVAKAPLTVTFDVNATGMQVFYGKFWTSQGSYELDQSEALPTDLYANGFILNGWKLSKTATESVKNFDAAAMYAAAEEGEVTLYADWAASDTVTKATITSASLAEGTMTLSQVVEGVETFSALVGEAGVQVPLRKDIELNVKFVAADGYSIDPKGFYTSTAAGGKPEAIAFTASGAKFTVAGDAAIAAPTKADGYEFAFDANVGGDVELFYTGSIVRTGSYSLAMSADERLFPANLYRKDACLAGWSLTADGTGSLSFDEALVAAYVAAGSTAEKLYAIWDETCEQPLVTVTVANSEVGSVKLTNTIDGSEYTVGESFVVPAVDGIDFTVSRTLNSGFIALYDEPLFYMNGENKVLLTDGLHISSSMTAVAINIPAVANNALKVVFDVNATDMQVFYGKFWTSQGSYELDQSEALPTDIYANDYVLNGWKLSKTATESVKNFDATTMYAAAVNGEVTLYADWAASDTVTKATITSASKTEGTMILSQVVDGVETFSAQVGLGGVQVPLRKDIELNVKFVTDDGYSIDPNGFYTSTAAGGKPEAIAFTADGAKFTVSGDAAIAAPVKADGYQFAFDVNTTDNVFYVNQKVESGSYSLAITDKSKLLFPNGFYRAGYCHTGWALTATATTGYDRFDANFVAAVEQYAAPGKLYAVWTSGACDHDVTFSVANAAAGSVKLTDANSGKEYVLNAENSLQVPAVTGIQFTVESTVDEGYINLTGAPLFYMSGEEKIEIDASLDVDESMTAVAINIPAVANNALKVVFDVNASDMQVFYGKFWKSQDNYELNESAELPVDLYANDYVLNGWKLSKTATESVKKFDAVTMHAASVDGEVTLYADWAASDTVTKATITSASRTEGQMFLSQVVEGEETFSAEVGVAGVQVPLRKDIELNVKFVTDDGYSIDPNGFYTSTAAGGKPEAIAFTADGAKFTVSGDAAIAAPVKADGYQFAFDVNTSENVFYVNQKVESGSYSLAITDKSKLLFPNGFYRAGYCHTGWALTATATTGYDRFDANFVAAVEQYAADNDAAPGKLYAVWTSGACDHDVTFSVANAAAGSVKLVNTNDNKEYVLDAENSLQVPAVAGIQFAVEASVSEGYINLTGAPLFYMSEEEKIEIDGTLDVVESMTAVAINIPAVANNALKVVFDVNATGMQVFYGKFWTSQGSYELDQSEALPTDIYANDYVLNGWKLSKTATESVKNFDATTMYAAAVNGEVTLYADWAASDTVTKATITSASKTEGQMFLSQVVEGEETFSAEVGVAGVQVPLRKDIELNVKFVANDGYSIDPNGFYTSTAAGGKAEAIAFTASGAKFTVSGDAAVAAPTKADGYEFAFDVNTSENVFYVKPKVESASYNMAITDKSKLLFPEGFYRAGYCHTGWAFTSTATAGYTRFDADFVAAVEQYAADNDAAPGKLYAVWTSGACDHDVTISVANAAVGSVKLTDANSGKEFVLNAENSLQVPAVTGIQFTVESTVDEGYINLTGAPLFYMSGEEKIEIDASLDVDESMTAVAINIPAVAKAPLTVTFDVNATGMQVFYGKFWTSQGSYELDQSESLPTDVYANGYVLNGWKLSKTATESVKNFDAAAMYAAAVEGEVTLYADWAASDTVTKATITSANLVEGTMALSQVVEGVETFSAVIGESGVQVPLRKDIELNVKFVANDGYSIDPKGFYTSTAVGGKAEAIAFTASGAKFTVSGDALISAPVATNAYEFAFDANVGGDVELFYTGSIVRTGSYSLAMSADDRKFPANLYRKDACLAGWSLTADGTGSLSFDEALVAAYVAAGSTAEKLYAIWDETCEQPLVTLTVANAEVGSVKLTNTIDGSEYTIGESFVVPAVDGIDFTVSRTLNSGFIALYDEPLFYMNGENKVSLADGLHISSSMTSVAINIPAVANNALKVVFDVNATDMQVFYGQEWVASNEYSLTMNATLPTNIYSVSHKLNGWKLNNSDTATVFTKFNAEAMYAAATDNQVTLLADWAVSDTITTATITSANLIEGKMTLSQIVDGEETFSADVGEAGVQVPKRRDIMMKVVFVPNDGYSFTSSFYTSTDVNNKTSAIAFFAETAEEGAQFNVMGDGKISAPVVANSYIFTFDANVGENEDLFYVGAKVEAGSYKLSENDGAEFPKNLYRAGACLNGWSLVKGGASFNQFDADFVKALEGDASDATTLYAVWNTECEQPEIILTVANAEMGSVKLVNTNDKKSFTLDAEHSLKVPAIEGINFTVSHMLNNGYISLNKEPLYYMVGSEKVQLADGELNLAAGMKDIAIYIPAVENKNLEVVFNVNASEGMNVFYGVNWIASSEYSLTESEILPTNLYSVNHKLNGWKLNNSDTATVFTKFNAEAMFAAATDNQVTLLADWAVSDTITTATITSANLTEGTMTLSQVVDGVETFSAEVGEAGVLVPMRKDIELNVLFAPATGYALTNGFYTSTNASDKVSAITFAGEGAKFNVAGNAKIAAPVEAVAYQFAFSANVAADVKLFYVDEKVEFASYSIAENDGAEFPTNIFRTDACLAGWSLTADGKAFNKFNAEFVSAYKENESVTLYAVWNEECERPVVRVIANDSEKGVITLTQTVNGKNYPIVLDGEITLPMVPLTFTLSYSVKPGYSAVSGSPVLMVDDESVTPIENNILTLGEQEVITLAIPATKDDAFEVVFSENTTERVFYGDAWERSGVYAAGGTNIGFPEDLYRTDAVFEGWAFTPRGTKSYKAFDDEFITALKAQKALGNNVDTLYARWTYGNLNNHVVSVAENETGTFFIYQVVDGVEGEPLAVDAKGVIVPDSRNGLHFMVNYVPGIGYSLNERIYVDGLDVYENVILTADVTPDPYTIVFNVNADENENVFYGRAWMHEGNFTVESHEEFTRAIYQADKSLMGWSLNEDGTGELYMGMNEALVEKLDKKAVNNLYAVWENRQNETYTVSFSNTDVGNLKLVQMVDDVPVAFAVGERGLKVPAVGEEFMFRISFNAYAGYIYDEQVNSMIFADGTGEKIEVMNNMLPVLSDVKISLPLVAEVYKLVFNVNSDRTDVIYGNGWVSADSYSMNDSAVISLPRVIYTADACVAGWTVGSDTTLFAEFSEELVKALKNTEPGEQGYVLNAQWKNSDACVAGNLMYNYDRVSLKSENGGIEFLETRSGIDAQFTVAHTFASDNTMLLPRGFNGVNLVVHSIPDSSYVLGNLVMTRSNNSDDVYSFTEGESLVLNLTDGEFTANFVKANKAKLQIVESDLEQSGNAIRLSFATNDFEVTRDVKVNVSMMDSHGNIVVDTLLTDPIIATPVQFSWSKHPINIGEYTVIAEIYDAVDTATVYKNFSVEPTITAISDGGWQMISLAAVDTAAIVWDDDPAFFWWDEHSKSGEYWQYKEFVAGSEIIADRGYWYSSLEGRPLALNPDAKSAEGDVAWTLDSVYSGWNLVANPYGWNLNLFNDNKSEIKAANEESKVEFWRYNSETAEYEEALVLKPFEAVWARVGSNTSWNLKAEPEFVSDIAVDFPGVENTDSTGAVSKRKILAKASAKNNWSIQAILADNRGKQDSWNILGVSSKPFVSEEPPEAQGDHVTLSVMDGKRALAKSFKAVSDSYEWELALSATSERMGTLSLVGVNDLRSLGYHVFVTVDGKTVEMSDGENVRVALKSRATTATVRVTAGKFNVVAASLDGLHMTQAAGKVQVGFNVDESLAGSRTVVDILNLDGKVLATYSSKAQAGRNLLTLDAPRAGLYMLRVRVASQQVAGKVMVK